MGGSGGGSDKEISDFLSDWVAEAAPAQSRGCTVSGDITEYANPELNETSVYVIYCFQVLVIS